MEEEVDINDKNLLRDVANNGNVVVRMVLRRGVKVNPLAKYKLRLEPEMINLLTAAGVESGQMTFWGMWNLVEKMGLMTELFFNDQNAAIAHSSLMRMCRTVIRRHLLRVSDVNLFYRVPMLWLPKLLERFLLYDQSVEDWTVGCVIKV